MVEVVNHFQWNILVIREVIMKKNKDIFKKHRDREIANAVIELLKRANSIENFNKKALYVLIREMTNSKTVHITKVINKMKIHVLKQTQEYRKSGYLVDPSMLFVYNSEK